MLIRIALFMGIGFCAAQVDPNAAQPAPISEVAVVPNKTDEELEVFLGLSEEWKVNLAIKTPYDKRRGLLLDYAAKSNEEILKTKSEGIGLQISFKDEECTKKFFLLDRKGRSRSMSGLMYRLVKSIRQDSSAIEDLPTTGEIDALNEKIKQLPKTQMSFWEALSVMNPARYMGSYFRMFGSGAWTYPAVDLLPDFLRNSIGYYLINPILVSFTVASYYFTGNLYVADATNIGLPTAD